MLVVVGRCIREGSRITSAFWPKACFHRSLRPTNQRRREIKVPSPPTREGRGEGKACVKFRFWLSPVVVRSPSPAPSPTTKTPTRQAQRHEPWWALVA